MITEQSRNELLAPKLLGQAMGREVLMRWGDTYKVKRWWDLSERRVPQTRDHHVSIGSSWLDQKPWYFVPHPDRNDGQLVIGTTHFHRRLLDHFAGRVGQDQDSDKSLTDFVKDLDDGEQVLQWHSYEWPILGGGHQVVVGVYTEQLSAGLDRWINWYLELEVGKVVN